MSPSLFFPQSLCFINSNIIHPVVHTHVLKSSVYHTHPNHPVLGDQRSQCTLIPPTSISMIPSWIKSPRPLPRTNTGVSLPAFTLFPIQPFSFFRATQIVTIKPKSYIISLLKMLRCFILKIKFLYHDLPSPTSVTPISSSFFILPV